MFLQSGGMPLAALQVALVQCILDVISLNKQLQNVHCDIQSFIMKVGHVHLGSLKYCREPITVHKG